MEIALYVSFAASAVIALLAGSRAAFLVRKEVAKRAERAGGEKAVTAAGQ